MLYQDLYTLLIQEAMSKDGFVIYKSFYSPIQNLSDESLGKLLRAIFEYQINGVCIELPADVMMAFHFFKSRFDIDNEKYESIVERNKNNGKKGGRPSKNELAENPKNPMGFEEPKKADKDRIGEDIDIGLDEKEKEDNKLSSQKKDADFSDGLPKEDKPKRQPKATKQSNWRGDYDEYKAIVDKVCDELMKDEERKKRVLQLYPSADYERTVIKWYQYWGSEQGWNNKKKGTSNSINMFNTFDKTYTYSIVNVNNAIPSPPPRKEVIPDGEWADGTYVLNGYRYYNSPKTGQRTSVAMNAPIRPNEWAEYDYRNNNWITPIEHDNGIFW